MPEVFISYSHDSPEHAERVLALADRLIQDGLDCILDQYEGDPPEGWPRWTDRKIKEADLVLMVCTETYYKRVMGEEEVGKRLGVKWEGRLIYQHIYQAEAENTKFIPVLFEYGKVEHIPTPLQGGMFYWLDSEEGYEQLYWRLTNQYKIAKPAYGQIRKRSQKKRKLLFEDAARKDGYHPEGDIYLLPEKISLAKLPTTGSELFGREQELEMLDNAWTDPHTHIVSIVAWGGVGKTALVNEWLNRLERDNYRGTERVYGWSFYSQGTREDRQISADEFIFHALSWFGDPDPAQGSPWDKGVRLAGLIRQYRTLLILDGMEPLQYPPGEMHGRLRDQGLQALLKELVRSQSGLCITTTRVAVKDLEHAIKSSVKRVNLEHLSHEAGAKLLESLGVKGTFIELQETSQEFKGHALALNLLGRYLAVVHNGDIRKRNLIPHLTEEEEQGGHAYRVMESYECWLSGTPELNILYMMGLFDRPAAGGAIEALKAKPLIEGLTSELHNLSPAKWQYAVKRLRDLRLLAEKSENCPDTLDCHPLVREHFGEKFRSNNPNAWKDAHSRLYEYYKNLPAKHLPDTLEEMEPLFAAVAHGCQAGRHQETLSDVYRERIVRKEKYYQLKKLGAFGADLAALSNFFEIPWNQPVSGLTDDSNAWVLSIAGFDLRALGRLEEAAKPMQAGLEDRVKQKHWKNAAINTNNLSELYLTLGKVKQAVNYGRQSVRFADRSEDAIERYKRRTTLANALYQAGELLEAENLFREAETIQKEWRPEYPYLSSLSGFHFCDLLLSQKQYQEVQKRVTQTIEIAKQNKWILGIALNTLSLGRSIILQVQIEGIGDFTKAREYLNQAMAGFRKYGDQRYIVHGLLARAALCRFQQEFSKAWDDLKEAREIAERGSMKLYLADYHLEACRLCLAEKKDENARQHLSTAKTMVDEMGYHRRDKEVEELTAALKNKEADII